MMEVSLATLAELLNQPAYANLIHEKRENARRSGGRNDDRLTVYSSMLREIIAIL